MEYKIEKGIPRVSKQGVPRKYPWREMDVGDSFFVGNRSIQHMSSCAGTAAKSIGGGVKFSTGKENGGTRVWRIA
jgi:hypothetical protein